MAYLVPKKLKRGDEIRIIAPSTSMGILSEELQKISLGRLTSLGFKVTFGGHIDEMNEFESSPISQRIEDLHAAFLDKNVKAVLTVIGGFNSNQLLRYIDFGVIRKNPKIFCGFSDITALQNAILKKSSLVGYSGPAYVTFGQKKGLEYTLEYFKKCVIEDKPFEVLPSPEFRDERWYKDQEHAHFIKNKGYYVINPGSGVGTIIGGNLCTLNLLQGTDCMPDLKNSIVFIEDDSESKPQNFDRDLQSLIMQEGFEKVQGLVIGRFQKASKMTREKLIRIIKTKKELKDIPVIADADFGHTTPMITFPIGGKVEIRADGINPSIKIIKH